MKSKSRISDDVVFLQYCSAPKEVVEISCIEVFYASYQKLFRDCCFTYHLSIQLLLMYRLSIKAELSNSSDKLKKRRITNRRSQTLDDVTQDVADHVMGNMGPSYSSRHP